MVQKFTNNATSKLAAPIDGSSTQCAVMPGDGAKFPTLAAGDYFMATLINSAGDVEIVEVTARATDMFTITRAQEGTAAITFSAGDRVESRFTAGSIDAMVTATAAAQTTANTGVANAASAQATADSANSVLAALPWVSKAVGEPFALRDDLAGVVTPPTNDSRFRYIKLTAGDAYNSGVLGSESVSGTAPSITATAVITLAGSPLNGLTVNLWNTERRSPRGGSAGTLQDDQARVALINDGTVISGNIQMWDAGNTFRFDKGDSEIGVIGSSITETRVRNQGVTYYMRVL